MIARTIIRKPKILIFDEATSSLDGENQKLLQEAILRVSKNITTIIIAHRIPTVQNCDTIIILKDGKVSEKGSPSELLKKSKRFQKMVAIESFDPSQN